MRLDFSKLSQPVHHQRGQRGTAGTTNRHGGYDRPQSDARGGDPRGHCTALRPDSTRANGKLSTSSPVRDNGRGQPNPAWIHTVPVVPDVPIEKESVRNAPGEIDLVREFMDVDGLTLAEAQALLTVSVQPQTPEKWLALITELDDLIERYCALTGTTGEAKGAILGARRAQSAASIPDSLEWFQRELSDLEAAMPVRRPPSAPV